MMKRHANRRWVLPEAALAALIFLSVAVESGAQTTLDKPPEAVTEAELWEEYYGWRKADEPAKAHDVAVRLMEMGAEHHGEDSAEFGKALAEVGTTEVILERHDEALEHLQRAEKILRERLPLYSENLITPFSFLGSALQAAGRHEKAMDSFTWGQHITHRLWGINNPEQIRIVYAKADSAQAMGDLYHAEELHRHANELHRINYGADSPEAIAASAWLGTWLRSIGLYNESLTHFHQALSEVQGDGPDLPQAYPLLRGMAHAFRGGFRGRYARSMYERIIELMKAHPDDFTVDQRVEAHLVFGDWLMQRYFERDAVEQYVAAWQFAQRSGPAGRPWIEQLSVPKLVRYGAMAPFDVAGENRYLEFRFDLTDDGRPRGVKVTEHGSDSRDKHEARRVFPRLVRYRPPIVDGKPLAVEDHAVTMYVLPPDTRLEAAPVAAPERLTQQPAVSTTKVQESIPWADR